MQGVTVKIMINLDLSLFSLRSCLRCGSKKLKLDFMERDGSSISFFRVQCENGHAWDEWHDTIAEAVSAWNEVPTQVEDK